MKRFASALYELAAGPIPTRELRATFRGWRFVMLFTGAQVLALFIVWMTALTMEQDGASGSSIGQATFGILVTIQAGLIALLVPGFAGTSIVREKDKSTLELLSTTTIRPWQIVWGQLMAALGYVAVYLFAGLPLMALPFWYGGLSGWEPVLAYLGLFLLAALVAMWGVYSSATSQSVARAVGMSYVFIFLIGFPVGAALVELIDRAMRGHDDISELIRDISQHAGIFTVDAAYAFAAPFTFLFIVAVNRLKPWGANKSTALRVFAVCFLPIAGAVLLTDFTHFLKPRDIDERYVSLFTWWMFVSVTGILYAFFAAEPAPVGPRMFKQLDALRGPRAPLRFFAPGARRGFVFALLTTIAVLVVGGAIATGKLAPDADQPDGALWLTALVALAPVVFAAGLCLWLSSLRIPPGLARAIAAFTLIGLPIGAAVWQFAANGGYPDDEALSWGTPGYLCYPWVLYKSFYAVAWPGSPGSGGYPMPKVGLAIDVWVPFVVFHYGLGVLMAGVGWVADSLRESANRAAAFAVTEAPPAKAAP